MVIGRRSLLLAGVAVPVAARGQCVTDTPAVDACRGGVRITQPPGVTLDLSFFGPTLDPSLTFTRASTATYFDSSGVMQTAATNAPRFDYDPVTHAALGLLIEEQRTNVLLQTRDISNAVWSTAGGAGGTAPLVTANQGVSPDGTTTAARAAYGAASGGMIASIYQSVTATAAQYTFSVYLRGVAGGEQIYIYLTDGASAYPVRQRVTLTTAWQRFVITSPSNLTAAAWYSMIGTDLRDGGQTSTPSGTMFIWGAQLELGGLTSYIPTTAAAVTRNAELCTGSTAAWFNTTTPAGTVQLEALLPVPSTASIWQIPVNIDDGTTSNRIQLLRVTGSNAINGQVSRTGVDAFNAGIGTEVPGTVWKGAVAWQNAAQASAFNGVLGPSNSAALTTIPTTTLRIGHSQGPGNYANGYIRRVRYWPRVLSNAELQSVTR